MINVRSRRRKVMNRNKIITAEEAINHIQDGWCLGIEGFVGAGTADDLCVALEQRYLAGCSPKNITLIHSSGPGDAATRGATGSPIRACING